MGNINIHNYESFIIDFIEGQLEGDLRAELLVFLDKHPEIKAEVESFEMIQIPVDENIQFASKDSLKQSAIHDQNYEDKFIEYSEQILSPSEVNDVEEFIANNPSFEKELKLFQLSKCEADKSIQFKSKKQLKKYPFYLQSKFYYSVALAASIALLIGLGIIFLNNRQVNSDGDPFANLNEPKVLSGSKSLLILSVTISQTQLAKIDSKPIEINLSEINRFRPDQISSIRTNIKQLQNFAFNYKARIDQTYLLEKSEFYNPQYYELVAQVQLESNRVKVSQAIWQGFFGKIGFKKTESQSNQDKDKSSDGVVFWALTSIGVDHINTLTGSDLKLHRKVNDEGEFSGYKISNKEYNTLNTLEDNPK